MRLAQIATILAPHLKTAPEDLQGILRGPILLKLLEGLPGKGPTSPTDYDKAEVARARLLLAARSCGLSGEELTTFNSALNQPPTFIGKHPNWAQGDGAVVYPSALHSIIRGAKEGETWVVELNFTQGRDGQRNIKTSVYWLDGDETSSRAARAVRLLDLHNGETHLGTLLCPASDLILPVLAYVVD